MATGAGRRVRPGAPGRQGAPGAERGPLALAAPRPRPEPALVLLPAATRRLLTAWLGLALASLVVAGVFAMLAAFARTPAVHAWFSGEQFRLALTAHVTFAFTVWFVTFAGALWIYVAWRSNYPLSVPASWAAVGLATAGTVAMAVPAVLGAGTPYLNDYLPVIDHPLFWAGLVLVGAGVALQAAAYLLGMARAWARAGAAPGAARPGSPEGLAMGVGAGATLLAATAFLLAWAGVDPGLPFGWRLRAVVWGGGHVLQYLHVSGMVAAWLVALAVGPGVALPARRVARLLLWTLVPFMAAAAGAYLLWRPDALLTDHLVTVLTFGGLGAAGLPLFLMAVAALRQAPGRLPWRSPLLGGTAVSLGLFALGGLLGLIGMSQDTRVPAHYHGMVGAVTLAYMGLTPSLLALTGRRAWSPRLAGWQPWLYGVGLLGLMLGMHWAGGHGAPRKTFGFSWANAQALIGMNVMGVGSVLALLGGLAFVANAGLPLCRRPAATGPPEEPRP